MLKYFALVILLVFAAVPAAAQNDYVRDRIVQNLREDGYSEIRISRTFLGRMRFVATSDEAEREIVVNPVNGVILRDYIRFLRRYDDDESSGRVEENDDDDDDDDDDKYDDDDPDYDDDEEDDEEESDNSGPGSSNSGRGSDD